MNKKEKGKFIVFEGIDGAGKSTMVKKAMSFLNKHGIKRETYKFPSEKLEYFCSYGVSALSDAVLYTVDQFFHKTAFEYMLSDGVSVIADRYMPSVYAYQVTLEPKKCKFETIREIENALFDGFKPDHILLFDLPADVAAMRVQERDGLHSVLANETAKQLTAARKMYLRLAAEDSERYTIIDANNAVNAVWQQVVTELKRIFDIVKD